MNHLAELPISKQLTNLKIINNLNLEIKNCVAFCNGIFQGISSDFSIKHISIDSRSLQNGNATLFFAIKGKNHDGHLYIDALISKGVQYFVVEKIPLHLNDKANFIVVENSLKALQQIAMNYRNQFDFPFVAITGSAGKTIVKEWLNFMLSSHYKVVRNPKSYNSQVGVPLSILEIEGDFDFGIFEAGISLPDEMEKLETIIQPKYGILTNISNVHDEGFLNRTQKIEEKLKLFQNCEVVFMEKNASIENLLPKNIKITTWSFTNIEANLLITKEIQGQETKLYCNYSGAKFSINIPFTDANSIENAITCIQFLLFLNWKPDEIQEKATHLYPVELRLQAKKGIHNCLIIDDSFSLDIQSLKIALDFLEQQHVHTKKTIILSDIFTENKTDFEIYKTVKQLLIKNKIDRVITIGTVISSHLSDLQNVITFENTATFLQQFNTHSFQNETVLIKGARGFQFREIVVLLEEKNHETVLEINLDAISYNLNFYKSKLLPQTKIMVMVKAFGYGNGGYEIAKLLEHHQVDYLGVAFADEGIELRKAGITMPIMVLNPENSSFKAMIAYQLEPEIYAISGLKAFLIIAQQQNIANYPIHIKIDTGMHRLGFEKEDLSELCDLLKNNNFITVKSVFSHLAASDDLQFDAFTKEQFHLFDVCFTQIQAVVSKPIIRHVLNTSGIFNYPEKQMEMVRLGIGLYGIGNSVAERASLENVSTLKTVISQIKVILPEESIGYSRKFIAKEKIIIATLPIGYADGIRRSWGNEKGYVLINNQKATILGSICMDMMMVDITNIPCNVGDEVIIFGTQLRVTEIATAIGTISYEILTGISQRVKRIFYKN